MLAQNQIKSLDHATLSFKFNGIMKKINYLIFWDNRPTFDFWMQAVFFAFIRIKMADYVCGRLVCHTSHMLDTLWRPAEKEDFRKKKIPKRKWLCAWITPLLYRLRTWSKCQKMRQVFKSALEKNPFGWEVWIFLSDVISGGLLGHLGPLYLAPGPNR